MGAVHPYVIGRMVQERQDELLRQRTTDGPSGEVATWRRSVGRALAGLAVSLAVPRTRRATTRIRVGDALCPEP